jgi:hypothetical protein
MARIEGLVAGWPQFQHKTARLKLLGAARAGAGGERKNLPDSPTVRGKWGDLVLGQLAGHWVAL